MPSPLHTQNLHVYLCDGHRPAHDSAPFASGIALTSSEYQTLTSRISTYLEKCRMRRMKEQRCPHLADAAGKLHAELQEYVWFTCVGMSEGPDGKGELIVYVNQELHRKQADKIPISYGRYRYRVVTRIMERPRPAYVGAKR